MTDTSTARQGIAYFSITGEFITATVRDAVLSDMPQAAMRILAEGLTEMPIGVAYAILRGDKRLDGVNTLEVIDEDPAVREEYQGRLRYLYAGRFVVGTQTYRPYAALVCGWDGRDMKGRPTEFSMISPRFLTTAPSGSMDPTSRFRRISIERALYYARDPAHDCLGSALYVSKKEALRGSPTNVYILSEVTEEVPPWWTPLGTLQEAVDDIVAVRGGICEDGADARRTYPGDKHAIGWGMAPHDARVDHRGDLPPPELPGDSSIDVYRRMIREALPDVSDDSGWMDLHVKRDDDDDGPVLYRVPRAAFAQWALRGSAQAYAPPWTPISPPGTKMSYDNPYHTDWITGAIPDIDVGNWYSEDAIQAASFTASLDVQRNLAGVTSRILCGEISTCRSGRVVHPKPGAAVPPGAIVVIPTASSDYTVAALSAGPTGAIITERGGPLAHLTIMGRENQLFMVRVPDAVSRYPVGSHVFIYTDGRIDFLT